MALNFRYLCIMVKYIYSLIHVLVFLLPLGSVSAQYFQQKTDYDIDAQFNEDVTELSVNVRIDYYNYSPYIIDTIPFHIWADAFSDERSAFSEQLLKLNNSSFYFSKEDKRGGYNTLDVVRGGRWVDHPDQVDLGYIVLDKPIIQGQKVEIEIKYVLKVPYAFSRMGEKNGLVAMTYWYPRPAVLDKNGWNHFSYLSLGEFYNEYGDYQVRLKIPDRYKMMSTGEVKDEGVENGFKVYDIKAEQVVDFAFFLQKRYEVREKIVTSVDGHSVALRIFSDPNYKVWNDHALQYLEESFHYYENEVGGYPYPQLTVVQLPDARSGGMEYPMIVTAGAKDEKTLDYYINHEVGHQWFYGVLGFNERNSPYLDEGLTTHFEHHYTIPKLGTDYHSSNLSDILTEDLGMPFLQNIHVWQKRRDMDEPADKDPRDVSVINYGLNAYERAAYCYQYLRSYLGEEVWSETTKTFYQSWKFKHPTLADFLGVAEQASEKDLSWFNALIVDNPDVEFKIEKEDKGVAVTNLGEIALPFFLTQGDEKISYPILAIGEKRSVVMPEQNTVVNEDFIGLEKDGGDNFIGGKGVMVSPFLSIDLPHKKEVNIAPLITYNYADGISLGLGMYNSTFPSKNFQYLIAPQYALGSNEVVGNAWLAYNAYTSSGMLRKIQYRLSARRNSDFRNDDLNFRTQYLRIDPSITFHFRKDPSSQKYSRITARSTYLNLERTVFSGPNEFTFENEGSFISQLRWDGYDFNLLARKEFRIELEHQAYAPVDQETQQYVKLTGSYKYGYKYKDRKSIWVRAYASGFLWNTRRASSSFNNLLTRGSIALLDQSFNDYSYEEYYLNRQANEGPFSNQINANGGGFKDALGPSHNIGLSNDFAASISLQVDLPMRLPRILPLRVFFDYGYYRTKGVSNDPLVGESIYSAGLMWSVLDGGLEIYVPLLSSSRISSVYSELGENVFQRISFSIDLHRMNPWDLIDDLNF